MGHEVSSGYPPELALPVARYSQDCPPGFWGHLVEPLNQLCARPPPETRSPTKRGRRSARSCWRRLSLARIRDSQEAPDDTELPEDIKGHASAALGQEHVIWRDI